MAVERIDDGRVKRGETSWSKPNFKTDGKVAQAFDTDCKTIEPRFLPMRLSKATRAILFYGEIDPHYFGLYRQVVVLLAIPEDKLIVP